MTRSFSPFQSGPLCHQSEPLCQSKLLRVAAFATILLCAAVSPAEEPRPDYARDGFYLVGTGNFQWENFHIPPLPSGDTDTSAGFSFKAGYRFHPHFSAELQYEWLHDFIEDALELGDAGLFGTNLRAYLTKGRLQPSIILGLNWMRAPIPTGETRDTFAVRAGIGFEFYASEHFILIADGSYVQPVSNGLADFPFGSIGGGIGYRF